MNMSTFEVIRRDMNGGLCEPGCEGKENTGLNRR